MCIRDSLRFDEWLAALEARRAATPEHVYSRVHGDYIARRGQVMTALHEHVPGLKQHLAELDARATELGARSQGEEDERAEAMLRHAVGEYDDAKWDEVRTRVEESLATLGTERANLDAQRDDVRSLLDSARPEVLVTPEAEPVAASAPEPEFVVAPEQETAPAESAAEQTDEWGSFTTPSAPPAVGAESATPDWLGAMTPASVPTQPSSGSAETGTGAVDGIELTPDEPSEAPNGVGGGFDRPSFWGARQTGVPDAAPEHAEAHESVDVFGNATSEGATAKGSAADSRTPQASAGSSAPAEAFDELAFLRSVTDPQSTSAPSAPKAPGTGDAQKTLRCTECGTMNLPTEWYCERCGGELAAF